MPHLRSRFFRGPIGPVLGPVLLSLLALVVAACSGPGAAGRGY